MDFRNPLSHNDLQISYILHKKLLFLEGGDIKKRKKNYSTPTGGCHTPPAPLGGLTLPQSRGLDFFSGFLDLPCQRGVGPQKRGESFFRQLFLVAANRLGCLPVGGCHFFSFQSQQARRHKSGPWKSANDALTCRPIRLQSRVRCDTVSHTAKQRQETRNNDNVTHT